MSSVGSDNLLKTHILKAIRINYKMGFISSAGVLQTFACRNSFEITTSRLTVLLHAKLSVSLAPSIAHDFCKYFKYVLTDLSTMLAPTQSLHCLLRETKVSKLQRLGHGRVKGADTNTFIVASNWSISLVNNSNSAHSSERINFKWSSHLHILRTMVK